MKRILITLSVLSVANAYASTMVTDSIPEQTLDEVVVEGEKPQIKSSNGVMTVDLASIVSDKPVTNILESLGYLPGVMSQGGMIALSGVPSTTIAINGEVSQMSVDQLYQLLYSMPIGRLKNVEIMYSAPAKYHVNGAVINVILKTPSALDGLQGQAGLGYDQSHYASYNGGLALVYAKGKWTFDVNYSLSKSKSRESEDMTSWHSFNDEIHLVEESNRRSSGNTSNQIYASVGYMMSDKSVLRATYNGQFKGDINSDNYSEGTFGRYMNRSKFLSPTIVNDMTLYYKSGFGLELSADWLSYTEKRNQVMSNMSDGATVVNSINNQRINRYRFTTDMEHDCDSWAIGYGAEYRLSADRSKMAYTVPDNPGFNNNLTEHTLEAYFGVAHSFSWGLSFQASISEEFYRMANRNNWTFLPQFSLTYYTDPTHIIQASLSVDRSFPSYWTLHGGVGYLNPYSEIWGNPNLMPTTTYSANASYIFRQKYVASLFFNDIDDYSTQLPYQSGKELKLIFQEQNADYRRTFGLNIMAPFTVKGWYDTRITFQGFYSRIKASHFHDLSYIRNRMTVYGSLQNTFKIGRLFSLSLDISGISKSLQGIADMSALWRVDAGGKWRFGKSECLEVNLKADDIFNTWSPVMRINYGKQNYRMKVNNLSRKIQITLVYRFNGFKPKDAEVDTSRLGTGQ